VGCRSPHLLPKTARRATQGAALRQVCHGRSKSGLRPMPGGRLVNPAGSGAPCSLACGTRGLHHGAALYGGAAPTPPPRRTVPSWRWS